MKGDKHKEWIGIKRYIEAFFFWQILQQTIVAKPNNTMIKFSTLN